MLHGPERDESLRQSLIFICLQEYKMLDFPEQKKLLEPILKHPSNHVCADCDTRSPTWASLDFGVFLCSNCSGAHRALGPTITRVKSANLDLWQEEWVTCMILGNEQLNAYWEGESSAKLNKPKMGASPEEIRRYVFNKYVKRKYVKNPGEEDPLTMYRNGGSAAQEEKAEQSKQEPEKTVNKKQELPQNPGSKPSKPHQIKKDTPKQEVSLLDFDVELQPPPVSVTQPQNQQATEEFTEYTECGTSFTNETSKDNFVDFNSLLQSHKQVQGQIHHSHSSQAVMQNTQLYQPQFFNQMAPNYGFAHQQPANMHPNYPSYAHSNYLQHPFPQVIHHSPPSHFPSNPSPPTQPFVPSWKH